MTDERAVDREARVAALMARRQGAKSPATPTAATAAKPTRRRHAAPGGRVLALGISASAAIVLTATMANSAPPDATLTQTTAQPAIVVHIVRADGQTSSVVVPTAEPASSAPSAAAPPAAVAAAPRAKASTKSRGS